MARASACRHMERSKDADRLRQSICRQEFSQGRDRQFFNRFKEQQFCNNKFGFPRKLHISQQSKQKFIKRKKFRFNVSKQKCSQDVDRQIFSCKTGFFYRTEQRKQEQLQKTCIFRCDFRNDFRLKCIIQQEFEQSDTKQLCSKLR